jgi:hypothetical protein
MGDQVLTLSLDAMESGQVQVYFNINITHPLFQDMNNKIAKILIS